jgi:hypothetical protein
MLRNISNLDQTEEMIVTAVEAVPEKLKISTRTDWTSTLKRQVGDLGKSLKWLVCASGFEDDFDKEWLYDLVWYENNDNSELLDVPLVLETEWDQDFAGIKYDFEKLLLSKARYKVMVFEGDSTTIPEALARLSAMVAHCRLTASGERYLFFAWNNSENRFEIEHIITK